VSQLIRQVRLRRGIGQAELAAAVGITRQRMGQIERGGYGPGPENCYRIADALGCEPDTFLTDVQQ
jgi:putative transcriptional regulator